MRVAAAFTLGTVAGVALAVLGAYRFAGAAFAGALGGALGDDDR